MADEDRLKIEHLVVTVHGIRTNGGWQDRLEKLCRADKPDARLKFAPCKFGFFSAPAFYFPFTRWLQVRRFRRDLEALVDLHPNLKRIDIFAHSFGTYIATWALAGKALRRPLPRIDNLVLAGSVLRRTHPWLEMIGSRVSRVVNEVGDRDNVLLLNQLFVPFVGAAGLLGFQTFEIAELTQRYYNTGHSGYFEARDRDDDWFLRRFWVPIVRGTPGSSLEQYREEKPLTALRGVRLFALNNSTLFKLTIAAAIVGGVITYLLALYAATEEQRKLAVARLSASEAARISRNFTDPVKDQPVAALLAVEALRRLPPDEASEFLWQNALRLAPVLDAQRRGPIEAMKLDPAGKTIAVGLNGTILVGPLTGNWKGKTAVLQSRGSHGRIVQLIFSSNLRFLASLGTNGFTIFDLSTKDPVVDLDINLTHFAFDSSGEHAAYSTSDQKLTAVNLKDGKSYFDLQSEVSMLAFLSGSRLVFAERDGKLSMVDPQGKAATVSRASQSTISALSVGPDSKRIAFVTLPGTASEGDGQPTGRLEVLDGDQNPPALVSLISGNYRAAEFLPTGSEIVVATDDGIVGTIGILGHEIKTDCDLHIIQEGTAVGSGYIEDNDPPRVTSMIASPNGNTVFVAADSPYAELRAFRFTIGNQACEKFGDLDSPPAEAVYVSEGKHLLLRTEDGSTAIVDMRLGFTVARELAGWAERIESGQSSNSVLFSQGPLLRGIQLEVQGAIDGLCERLGNRQLSEADWLVRFSGETPRPTCEPQ